MKQAESKGKFKKSLTQRTGQCDIVGRKNRINDSQIYEKGEQVFDIPKIMMKMKKILPLLLAVTMMAAGIPMAVYGEESSLAPGEPTESQAAEQNGEPGLQENSSQDSQQGAAPAGSEEQNAEAAEMQAGQPEEPSQEPTENTQQIPGEQTESGNVVTLGENLSDSQRASMYEYFGTSADKVRTIIVTHADEVKYMEGIATAQQIGATTNSCAYVEPTDSGGIKVKTANLNFVTSAMIASTLATAGMENCNVIAACPFEVSGTGALTGIIMAYETASGEDLDEDKKEAAMQELITTGELADSMGQEEATDLVNAVKTEVLDKGLTDSGEIQEAIEEIAEDQGVTLTEEQKAQLEELMKKISQFDYDLGALKNTLNNLEGKLSGLSGIWHSIKSFFVGTGNGILSDTNDEALGDDVITDSTVDDGGFKDGLWTRIKKLFTGDDD